jgi:DMSO/TMAO reductase YedYZ molybdopterin-dependent catalytic subunit
VSARLIIRGRVATPRAFTFADLRAFAHQLSETSPLLAGREIAGIPLTALLELARPHVSARSVIAESADGSFVSRLPLDAVAHCVVIYRVSGAALPASLGGPFRLITAGRLRRGDVKQLGAIYVSEQPFVEIADSELISVRAASH